MSSLGMDSLPEFDIGARTTNDSDHMSIFKQLKLQHNRLMKTLVIRPSCLVFPRPLSVLCVPLQFQTELARPAGAVA
ncbi:hypothetical protein GOP47_0026655 [Adiantum capillus-veneris]|nr:hypothetical protein GOP47_0026655 [Adiantum capillus-veneris]